jgi:hypothetical protein
MGKFKRTEGPPAYGEGYHERMLVMIRIEEQGPEVIHKEIADLWSEIMLRTDCLVEHEIAQVQDEINKKNRKRGRK